jgi:hypothetical protein
VVQVGIGSFKFIVDTAIATALFIYRLTQVTDTNDILDFKLAAHMPRLKLYTSRK